MVIRHSCSQHYPTSPYGYIVNTTSSSIIASSNTFQEESFRRAHNLKLTYYTILSCKLSDCLRFLLLQKLSFKQTAEMNYDPAKNILPLQLDFINRKLIRFSYLALILELITYI
ncbi:conserved hypothetical protein [Trichinella spiralis]|uniref:hypothetical protein n=1 Tax=Trichinella spiralis TaxID=6334 RepID=UPI0001EFD57B|nr:conserved hypothetical protein [Trichinella spiralis]